MLFHGGFQFASACARLYVEPGIERVELEEVAMGLARRRAWAAIADAPRAIT